MRSRKGIGKWLFLLMVIIFTLFVGGVFLVFYSKIFGVAGGPKMMAVFVALFGTITT